MVSDDNYKLIHIKHREVLRAYLSYRDTIVQYLTSVNQKKVFVDDLDFLDNYDETLQYQYRIVNETK